MKYKPEPISKADYIRGEFTIWTVDFDDEGYEFNNQDDAMTFCLLLEIRDLLKENL